jgi:hypothetical protein
MYREFKKTPKFSKNQWFNEEMCKWTNRAFSTKEAQMFKKKKKKKPHEEMLNIPGHKADANQNHIKILPHSS